jgi:hypothetical protein
MKKSIVLISIILYSLIGYTQTWSSQFFDALGYDVFERYDESIFQVYGKVNQQEINGEVCVTLYKGGYIQFFSCEDYEFRSDKIQIDTDKSSITELSANTIIIREPGVDITLYLIDYRTREKQIQIMRQ